MSSIHGIKSAVAAVGVGLIQHKRGTSPVGESGAVVHAIVNACEDAGFNPSDVDGFVSYGDDHNQPDRMLGDLGTKELRLSTGVWGGGAGGLLSAVEIAAMAVATGQSEAVVVCRGLVQGTNGRLSGAVAAHHLSDHMGSAGVVAPAHICGLRAQRMIEQRHLPQSAVEALVRADYYHASRNPDAVAFGNNFTLDDYYGSREIAGPFRLYDASRENDGAGAVLFVSAERAKDLKKKPVYVVAAAGGAHKGWGDLLENDDDYTATGFKSTARRIWEKSGLGPKDVDVTQLYENFSHQGLSALVDHGLTTWESMAEDIVFENLIAQGGRIPVNTSGGNLAQGFIHGINILIEGVRQLRGESANPVLNAKVCLVTSGPGCPINSSALFANEQI